MDVIGKTVRSKTGDHREGTITDIQSNKISVSFVGGGSIDVSIDLLEIDERLKNEILVMMNNKTAKPSDVVRKHLGKQRFVNPKIMTTPNMIYFNIAYMKYYKGITEDDFPSNGGRYIGETGNAEEKYNFLPFDNEYVYGYAEPGYTKGGYEDGIQKEIHIENIDPSCIDSDHINNVIVILCAKNPETGKTVMVGWYENATVYRRSKIFGEGEEQRWVIMKCKIEDAHLIDHNNRNFIVPRAKQDGIGFGQTNFWYANNEQDYDFRIKTLDYIKNNQ